VVGDNREVTICLLAGKPESDDGTILCFYVVGYKLEETTIRGGHRSTNHDVHLHDG